MKWWKSLSKTTRYITAMSVAFGVIALYGIVDSFIPLPEWLIYPVMAISASGASYAYVLRIS